MKRITIKFLAPRCLLPVLLRRVQLSTVSNNPLAFRICRPVPQIMILPLSVTSTFFFILNVRKIRPTSVLQYVSHNHMTDYILLLSLLLQSHIRVVSCTPPEAPVLLLYELHHLHRLRQEESYLLHSQLPARKLPVIVVKRKFVRRQILISVFLVNLIQN